MAFEKGQGKGGMTVEEAGHRGGQRVKELVEEGKEKEGERSSVERPAAKSGGFDKGRR